MALASYPAGRYKVSPKPNDQTKFIVLPLATTGSLSFSIDTTTNLISCTWRIHPAQTITAQGKQASDIGLIGEEVALELSVEFENDETWSFDKVVGTGGRTVRLGFHEVEEKIKIKKYLFFWLQGIDERQDEEFIRKVKSLKNKDTEMTDGAVAGTGSSATASTGGLTNAEITALLSRLPGLQKKSATGGNAGKSAEPATFRNALNEVNQQLGRAQPTNLLKTVTEIDIDALLTDDTVKRDLMSLLPPGLQTEEELSKTVHTAQFGQSVGSLSAALQSQNLDQVFAAFQLDPNDGIEELNRGDGTGAFLKALKKKVEKENTDENADPNTTTDDNMETD